MARRTHQIMQHIKHSRHGVRWVCDGVDNCSELAIRPLLPFPPLLFGYRSEDSVETACQLELQSVAIGNIVGFTSLRAFGKHSCKIASAPCGSLIGEPG